MTDYANPGRCGACGDRMTFGPHYHEPECPGCGADLLDGIGSDADDDPLGLDDDGRTYCGSCGHVDPVHGWAVAEHRRRGNRPPPRPAPLAPDEIAERRRIVTVGAEL